MWVTDEISKELKKYFEGNENTDVWDAVNAVLRERCIVVNTSIRKEERSEIDNLSFYFNKLEKEKVEEFKPKPIKKKK